MTELGNKNLVYLSEIDRLSEKNTQLASELDYWKIKQKALETSQNDILLKNQKNLENPVFIVKTSIIIYIYSGRFKTNGRD